eukprot:gene6976-2540_t
MRSSSNWAQPEDGYRSCVGMNLAFMTTRAILLMLLSRFWFEVDEAKMGTPQEVDEKS